MAMPKFLSRTALLAILALTTTSSVLAGGEGWVTDFEAAKKQAQKEKKDLLIDFTGSDWCGWCIRLNNEVFSQQTFRDESPKHYVLVELDFPRDKSKMTEATIAQNDKLQEEFGVQGFPTIFLADAQGRPYAKTGYQPGGAEKYLTHLGELRAKREKRDEHFAKAEKAEGVERARHLDAGLTSLPSEMLLPFYSKTVDEIIRLDGENEAGLKAAYEAKQADHKLGAEIAAVEQKLFKAFGEGEEAIAKVMTEVDGLLEKTKGKGPNAQKLFLMQANVVFGRSQGKAIDEVVVILEKAVAADPESEMSQQLKGAITQLKARAEAQKESEESEDESEDESDEGGEDDGDN